MILGQFRQVIFEAGPPMQQQMMMQSALSQPTGLDQQISPSGDPVEYKPLKKYLLVQKLVDLKTKLDNLGISNSDLSTIIKFSNEFSYESLVGLSSHIINFINIQINGAKGVKK